ncbi:hypothetical protein [Halalkalicoccus subterraneus]|uniref:hypothetical protein n=1 Tax=Halalkalicoccus subterraneus TaxID=2675002 RepID=UPI000EFD5FC5|nr:hypothetical protein [Halalkalicoccus subterraneus]
MPAGTPDEWLFEDWLLIVHALNDATHENCRCYDCDTIDALLGDIAHYWDLNDQELAETMC